MPNIITRRSFLSRMSQAGVGLGLAALAQVPPFLRQALAASAIGNNGKKLIFIFLRGGNDGIHNVIPVLDPSYRGTGNANRNRLAMPMDPAADYAAKTGQADVTALDYPYAIRLGNGFATLNPALRDLVPIFNAGNLAVCHRVGYRSLSRSHFDSEVFWEHGTDGTATGRLVRDGVWYRVMAESGWNKTHPLSAVSIQSNMPASLRGEQPMTNLSSLGRYNIRGVYSAVGSTNTDRVKILGQLDAANAAPYAAKDNRALIHELGIQFRDTLDVFQDPSFQVNTFFDEDGSTYLFPSATAQDLALPGTDPVQYRVGSNGYGFIGQIRVCAQLLNITDTVIAGTDFASFDTHADQVAKSSDGSGSRPHLGAQANLLRRLGAAYYGLWRYFTLYGKGGARELPGAKVSWNDVVIVTMSEFGRTSIENDSLGTDHGEASVMYVGGGGVKGGVFGCDLAENSKLGGPNWAMGDGGKNGALYSADNKVGYLRRTIDYRSVIGEVIRGHLGATADELGRIIPAYSREDTEHLRDGGLAGTTPIIGELGII